MSKNTSNKEGQSSKISTCRLGEHPKVSIVTDEITGDFTFAWKFYDRQPVNSPVRFEKAVSFQGKTYQRAIPYNEGSAALLYNPSPRAKTVIFVDSQLNKRIHKLFRFTFSENNDKGFYMEGERAFDAVVLMCSKDFGPSEITYQLWEFFNDAFELGADYFSYAKRAYFQTREWSQLRKIAAAHLEENPIVYMVKSVQYSDLDKAYFTQLESIDKKKTIEVLFTEKQGENTVIHRHPRTTLGYYEEAAVALGAMLA